MKNPLQEVTEANKPARLRSTGIRHITRLAAAMSIAIAIFVLPAILTGAKVSAGQVDTACGTPSVFIFPNHNINPGTTVSIFVTESNHTDASTSFVVGTNVVSPSGPTVTTNAQVAQISASGDTNIVVSFPVTSSTAPGTYTVTAESYQGTTLPANPASFCASSSATFTVNCVSNDCTPASVGE
ncbi:MAG TPA: hypothetical protein VI756_08850 [Blastocatellia bacterium]